MTPKSQEGPSKLVILTGASGSGKTAITPRDFRPLPQICISFIQQALAEVGIEDATVVLVDCDDETRALRLQGARN